ncbi:SEC-C metal-binding domain-containing protein [Pedococcus sp. P5_B7]
MLAGSGLSSAAEVDEPVDTSAISSNGGQAAEADLVPAESAAATADKHPTFRAKGLEQPERRPQQLQYSAPSETGDVEHRAVGSANDTLSEDQLKGASRNGPCPCGSGKKFKMCHGKP